MSNQPGSNEVLFLRDGDGIWWVGRGPFSRQLEAPSERVAFWRSDFFNEEPSSWWIPHRLLRTHDLKWLDELWPEPLGENSGSMNFVPPRMEDFEIQFNRIQRAFHEQGLLKLVAVVEAVSDRAPAPHKVRHWITQLSRTPSKKLVYGGWLESEGFVGCTPEILCSWSPELVETMALAGTSSSQGVSLLKSVKDMHEHQLVVDDIRDQLGRWGEVLVAETKEWDLGLLKHLRTDLAVKDPPSFEEVVRGLHPTPALGGAPRDLAWNWLQENDSLRRPRYFGAPFGIYDPGRFGLAAVTIRQVYWRNGLTYLPSGCGVVPESEVEKEWAELTLKRRAVLASLGENL